MPRKLFPYFFLLFTFFSACTPTPDPDAPYIPGFFYFSTRDASLVLLDDPNAQPRQTLPLPPPPECSLFALRPAPIGRWIAVEWDCPSGPRVELFDTASGQPHYALNDQSIDNRLLAWHPDGKSIYIKAGTLSIPQTLRVDVATGQVKELPLSAFVYDLTVSPDGLKVLYSLSNGIGFGSETWLAGPNGQNPSQLLVEPENIIALAQFSPDSQQIAYIKFPDTQDVAPPGELWVMASDGSNAHRLATADAGRGFPPVWSPGGDQIAFIGRDDPADEKSINLTILDLKNSSFTIHHSALLTPPVWSPDATLMAYTAIENDTMTLWFYEFAAARAEKQVTEACCAGWIR